MDISSVLFDDWKDGSNSKITNLSVFYGDSTIDISNCLDVSALCCDEEVSGFDKNAGKTWIYPTNYPVRDYQFNIIKAALYKNTLVSLPTGLGKTFIAAVIMYNFYRWYPLGKILFTAPTRPLVAQQIDACYHIMGIPPRDTVEMTGGMQVSARKIAWEEKRVFFATPQVVYNDLKAGICPGNLIRCLVFDEAHRARGKYAYCQVVEILSDARCFTFRVLALSATPGSKVEDVINVVRNLHISHLELRSEQCLDVAIYSHARKIETVVVALDDELNYLKNEYIQILDLYTRRLVQYKVLTGNPASMSKGRIVMLFKEYQTKERGARHAQHKYIIQDFLMIITLYHGLELLTKHGARVFLNFFDEHPDKTWVGHDDRLTGLLERLRDDLGTNPMSLNRSTLPDGTYPEIPQNIKYGHPKFDRLHNIMLEHFKDAEKRGQSTKAIVFCEYRESVNLVHCLLLQCRPLIKPHMFIGQGTGAATSGNKEHMKAFSQKQQLRVMQAFRDGICNTLVSTSVGEEGLDVGNVDLIICFDISTKSPVRLVQRCGRTGRERGGRVVLLVTEGREHQMLRECMHQRDSLNKRVMQSKELEKNLYNANPRMLPDNITPECQKMYIKVDIKDAQAKTSKDKGQMDLRTMLNAPQSNTDRDWNGDSSSMITKKQFEDMYPNGYPDLHYFDSKTTGAEPNKSPINLSEWLEWQRSLQTTIKIGHSIDAEIFSDLLKCADSKRSIIPSSSQNPGYFSQAVNTQILKLPPPKKTNVKRKLKPPNGDKKDGDIRALFSSATKSTKEYTEMVAKLSSNDGSTLPTTLINLMVELNIENAKDMESQKCLTCDKLFDCISYNKLAGSKMFTVPLTKVDSKTNNYDFLNDLTIEDIKNIDVQDLITPPETVGIGNEPFFDESIFDADIDEQLINVTDTTNNHVKFDRANELKTDNIKTDSVNFDIGDIEDILGNNSSTSVLSNQDTGMTSSERLHAHLPKDVETNCKSADKTLNFFGLGSVDDIFADDDEVSRTENEISKRQSFISGGRKSPSLLSNFRYNADYNLKSPGSPILSSQNNFVKPTTTSVASSTPIIESSKNPNEASFIKASKLISKIYNHDESSIFNEKTREIEFDNSTKDGNNGKIKTNSRITMTPEESENMYTISQIIDMINKPDNDLNNKQNEISPKSKSTNLSYNCNTVVKLQDISTEKNKMSKSPIFEFECPPRVVSPNFCIPYDNPPSPVLTTQGDKDTNSPILSSQVRNSNKIANLTKKCDLKLNSLICDPDSLNANIVATTSTVGQKVKVFENVTIVEESSDDSDCNGDNLCAATTLIKYSQEEKNKNIESDDCFIVDDNVTFKTKRKLVNVDNCELELNFNKYPKLAVEKPKSSLSLKEKLAAAMKSTKLQTYDVYNTHIENFHNEPPTLSQKENKNPNQPQKTTRNIESDNCADNASKRKLNKLQIFKRDFNKYEKLSKNNEFAVNSMKAMEIDSGDEFEHKSTNTKNRVTDEINPESSPSPIQRNKKTRRKRCEFIEYEAEQSNGELFEDSEEESLENSQSGELNGSIIDFICDEEMPAQDSVDLQAIYLRSVRSPRQGKFKIPDLPKKHVNVLSQIDPDYEVSYEIDSFCVDGNEGLTQCNEMSELEIAEQLLREKRRKKRREKPIGVRLVKDKPDRILSDADSPIAAKRRNGRRRLQINSDSSDEDFT